MSEKFDILLFVACCLIPVITAKPDPCFEYPPVVNVNYEVSATSGDYPYKLDVAHCVVGLQNPEYDRIRVGYFDIKYAMYWDERTNGVTINSFWHLPYVNDHWLEKGYKTWACLLIHENEHAKYQTGRNECHARDVEYQCLINLEMDEDYLLSFRDHILCR